MQDHLLNSPTSSLHPRATYMALTTIAEKSEDALSTPSSPSFPHPDNCWQRVAVHLDWPGRESIILSGTRNHDVDHSHSGAVSTNPFATNPTIPFDDILLRTMQTRLGEKNMSKSCFFHVIDSTRHTVRGTPLRYRRTRNNAASLLPNNPNQVHI